MAGLTDKISGRIKQAAGDLADDPELRRQGLQEERKAQAKEELAHAQREAEARAEEIARLERETNRSAGSSVSGETDRSAGSGPSRPIDS